MIVNHATPMHDNFCRCRTCKPPHVGHKSDALLRVRVGTIGMGVVAMALIAARVTGAV